MTTDSSDAHRDALRRGTMCVSFARPVPWAATHARFHALVAHREKTSDDTADENGVIAVSAAGAFVSAYTSRLVHEGSLGHMASGRQRPATPWPLRADLR